MSKLTENEKIKLLSLILKRLEDSDSDNESYQNILINLQEIKNKVNNLNDNLTLSIDNTILPGDKSRTVYEDFEHNNAIIELFNRDGWKPDNGDYIINLKNRDYFAIDPQRGYKKFKVLEIRFETGAVVNNKISRGNMRFIITINDNDKNKKIAYKTISGAHISETETLFSIRYNPEYDFGNGDLGYTFEQ